MSESLKGFYKRPGFTASITRGVASRVLEHMEEVVMGVGSL